LDLGKFSLQQKMIGLVVKSDRWVVLIDSDTTSVSFVWAAVSCDQIRVNDLRFILPVFIQGLKCVSQWIGSAKHGQANPVLAKDWCRHQATNLLPRVGYLDKPAFLSFKGHVPLEPTTFFMDQILHYPSNKQKFLRLRSPARRLRSTAAPWLLAIPWTNGQYGDRSLGAVAPRLWNSLPVEMRCLADTTTYKKNLKTLLFKNIFE
jgi:hypothetical protein